MTRADARERAYNGPIDVTPARGEAWRRWKEDYAACCMQNWIAEGASRDEALHAGAVVLVDLERIDDKPWMPLGEALAYQASAILSPASEQPWEEDRRVEFIRSTRTAETSTRRERVLAAAYQLGITPTHADQIVTASNYQGRDDDSTGRTALYRHFDAAGDLLYVGIAKDPATRSDQHGKRSPWFRFVTDTSVEWFDARGAATDAERHAIDDERPIFNQTHNKKNRDAAVEYLFAALAGAQARAG